MLLDNQEVKDICEHTALHAKNGADLYVNERQKIRHYRVRSNEEEECQIAIFYFAQCNVKCVIIWIIYTHSIRNQP